MNIRNFVEVNCHTHKRVQVGDRLFPASGTHFCLRRVAFPSVGVTCTQQPSIVGYLAATYVHDGTATMPAFVPSHSYIGRGLASVLRNICAGRGAIIVVKVETIGARFFMSGNRQHPLG